MKAAVPETSAAVPNGVVPDKNVTVPPVGTVPLAGFVATAAVTVTDWPKTGAVGETVAVVVVAA